MKKRYGKWIFAVLFTAIPAILAVLIFVLPHERFSAAENRMLQKWEAPTVASVLDGSWQKQFDEYLTDHFPLRNGAVSTANTVKVILGARDLNGAWIGRNGRLFEKVGAGDCSLDEGSQGIRNIALIREFAAKHDLPTTWMPVPAAFEIYGEELPALASPYDAEAARAALRGAVGGDRVIDLCESFRALGKEKNLYYRTDHHWTADACAIAADAFLEKTCDRPHRTVSDRFYGSLWSKTMLPNAVCDRVEVPDADFSGVTVVADGKEIPVLDWAKASEKDVYTVFFGGNHGKMVIDTGKEGKTLLVLKDSFANSFLPELLASDSPYGRVVVIDLRYFKGSMTAVTAEEAPDEMLVLYELHNLLCDSSILGIVL